MCGICGFTKSQGIREPDIIERMKTALRHRGPDGHGTYTDEDIELGHTRLAVIDLEGGHQPMSDPKKRYHIVFNGEIYNFQSLGKTIEPYGYPLRTRSDTEILLYLYLLHGAKMVGLLEGMFAFAIWDKAEKKLFIARDRFGKKPLYYAVRRGHLIFASELKSLSLHPWVEKRLSLPALQQYLAFEYVPAPLSIYQDVFKLKAGHQLTWFQGTCRIEKYWEFPLAEDDSDRMISLPDVTSAVDRALDQAVQKRLVSDVPLGVLLSGGMDSSIVVAMMARHLRPSEIDTFSIGFRERSYNESHYARLVSDWFGTRHHEEIFDASKAIDILPAVIDQFDEPFADASALPTYLLSRFVRNHVTVALGGDGGDEMFAGYDTFVAGYLANLIGWVPSRWVNRLLLPLTRRLSVSDANMSVGFRLNRFLREYHHGPVLRNQRWLSAFSPESQERLFEIQQDDSDCAYAGLREIIKRTRTMHWLSAVQYAYVATYLQEDILTKIDRASMAHALEVRSPFLDRQVAELSASIPPRLKMKPACPKFVLKRTFRNVLPAAILNRSKKGFGIPKSKWLKEELKPQMRSYFDKERITQTGIFSAGSVRRIMNEHVNGVRDRQKELWTLLMFEMWRERHQAYL